VKLSNGSIGRHRANHLTHAGPEDPTVLPPLVKKSDLEVLETVIGRGADQLELSAARISTEQLLKAIELKHKLTEGSMFENFFSVLDQEGSEASEGPAEAPEALVSDEEASEAAPSDE